MFLPCPLHLAPYDLENWFISQWNHFIAPYIRGSVMAGVEVLQYLRIVPKLKPCYPGIREDFVYTHMRIHYSLIKIILKYL